MTTDKVLPTDIFINQVDTFISSYICKLLLTSLIGRKKFAGGDEDEEMDEDVRSKFKVGFENRLYVTSLKKNFKPNFTASVITVSNWTKLYSKIKHCDIFVYNIINDNKQIEEALWIANKLHEESDSFQKRKLFILISTAMTWANTKPLLTDEPDTPFTDADFRRRKAHPSYIHHLEAEKTVTRLGTKNKLKLLTYVIASGVTYGEEEDIFHPFFKAGWLNAPYLEIFGTGDNIIPTIHIKDLAHIVLNLVNLCPTTHYLLATENARNTLSEIISAISRTLTTGKVKRLPIEQAFESEEITQTMFDHLTISLQLDSVFAKENMNFKWTCEEGIVGNIKKIVKEFKIARNFIPIRFCILGPPMSGKTTLSAKLSETYSLPHITIKDVIQETITSLEMKLVSKADIENSETETGKAEEEQALVEEEDDKDPAEMLEEIQTSMLENKGRLPNDLLCTLIRKKLNSKPCQNQGYILDGLPKTRAQARGLFGGDEDDEEAENEEAEEDGVMVQKDSNEIQPEEQVIVLEEARANRERAMPDLTSESSMLMPFPLPTQLPKNLLPGCVVFLQATDRMLLNRVLRLPESEVFGTHNTEEGFLRRLVAFRASHAGSEVAAILADEELRNSLSPTQMQRLALATATNSGLSANPVQHLLSSMMAGSLDAGSVQAFFEDKTVSMLTFDIIQEESKEFPEILRKIKIAMGGPRNYGPSAAEMAEVHMRKEALRRAEEAAKKELERARAREENRVRDIRKKELTDMLEKVENDVQVALLSASKPLRAYLSRFIMPTLTAGILECVKQRPEDPLDYLAEYLFRHNPQVD